VPSCLYVLTKLIAILHAIHLNSTPDGWRLLIPQAKSMTDLKRIMENNPEYSNTLNTWCSGGTPAAEASRYITNAGFWCRFSLYLQRSLTVRSRIRTTADCTTAVSKTWRVYQLRHSLALALMLLQLFATSQVSIYTVSQKTSHLWLAITLMHVNGFWYFFGRNVTDKVGNQKMLYYATSNNLCFCTTCQNGETWKSHFSLNWIVLHTQCTCELSSWKKKIVVCDVFISV